MKEWLNQNYKAQRGLNIEIVELNRECIMKECNFKSEVKQREAFGCNLTSNNIVCCGEENCILYQIYKNTEINK